MTAPQTVADVQHTPGPWKVGGQHRRAAVYAGNTQVAFAREEYDRISSTVAEANARLIAAAPDFAAAAPHAADMLEQYADFIRRDVKADELERHPYLPALEQVIDDLRAALRAAATSARQGETK